VGNCLWVLPVSKKLKYLRLNVTADLGGQLPGSHGQSVYSTEGPGGQLPGCDHGVKSWKTSMSQRILAGNCQG